MECGESQSKIAASDLTNEMRDGHRTAIRVCNRYTTSTRAECFYWLPRIARQTNRVNTLIGHAKELRFRRGRSQKRKTNKATPFLATHRMQISRPAKQQLYANEVPYPPPPGFLVASANGCHGDLDIRGSLLFLNVPKRSRSDGSEGIDKCPKVSLSSPNVSQRAQHGFQHVPKCPEMVSSVSRRPFKVSQYGSSVS